MALKSWYEFLEEKKKKKNADLNALDLTQAQREYTEYLEGRPEYIYADDDQRAEGLSYVYGIPKEQLKDIDWNDETKLLTHTYRNYYNMKGVKPGEEGPLSFFDEKGNEDPRSPGLLKYDLSKGALIGLGEAPEGAGPTADMFIDSSGKARVARSARQLDQKTQDYIEKLVTAQLYKPKEEPHKWSDIITEDIPATITDYAPMYLGGTLAQVGRDIGAEGLTDFGREMRRSAEIRIAGKPQAIDLEQIASDLGKKPGEQIGIGDLTRWSITHFGDGFDDVLGELVKQLPFQAMAMAGTLGGQAIGAGVGALAGGAGAIPGAIAGRAAGAALSGYLEGALEGDEAYETALAMTGDDSAALRAANAVVGKNVALNSVLNYLSWGTAGGATRAGTGLMGAIGKSLVKSGAYTDDVIKNSTRFQRMLAAVVDNESHLAKLATRGERMAARIPFEAMGMVGTVAAQGGQEWAQYGFQEEVKGNGFWAQSPERSLETFLGGLGGGITDVAPASYNIWKMSEGIETKLAGLKTKFDAAETVEEKASIYSEMQRLQQFQQFTPALIDDWAQTAISSGADPRQVMMVIDEARNGITKRAMNMAGAITREVNRTWDAAERADLGPMNYIAVPDKLVDNLINSIKLMETGELPAPGGTRQQSLENVHKFVNRYYAEWATEEEQARFAQDVWKRTFGEALDEWEAYTPEARAEKEDRFKRKIVAEDELRIGKLAPADKLAEAMMYKAEQNGFELDPQSAVFIGQFGTHLRNKVPVVEAFRITMEANNNIPPNLTKAQALSLGLPDEIATALDASRKDYNAARAAEEARDPEAIRAKIKTLKAALRQPGITGQQKKETLIAIREAGKQLVEAKKYQEELATNREILDQLRSETEAETLAIQNQRLKEAQAAQKRATAPAAPVATEQLVAEFNQLIANGATPEQAMTAMAERMQRARRVRGNARQVPGRGPVQEGGPGQGGGNLQQQAQEQPGGQTLGQAQTEVTPAVLGQPTGSVAEAVTPTQPKVGDVIEENGSVYKVTGIRKNGEVRKTWIRTRNGIEVGRRYDTGMAVQVTAFENATGDEAPRGDGTDISVVSQVLGPDHVVVTTRRATDEELKVRAEREAREAKEDEATSTVAPAIEAKTPKPKRSKADKAAAAARKKGEKSTAQAVRDGTLVPGATINIHNEAGEAVPAVVTATSPTNRGLTRVEAKVEGEDEPRVVTEQAEIEPTITVPVATKADEEAFFGKGTAEAPRLDESAEERHQRLTAPMREELAQVEKRLADPKLDDRTRVQLEKHAASLRGYIEARPVPVRRRGTGIEAEAVDFAKAEAATEKPGGEEVEDAAARIEAQREAAAAAIERQKIEAAATEERLGKVTDEERKREEAEAKRLGTTFEEAEKELMRRLGVVLHASGTGRGATVEQEENYKAVHAPFALRKTVPPGKRAPGVGGEGYTIDEINTRIKQLKRDLKKAASPRERDEIKDRIERLETAKEQKQQKKLFGALRYGEKPTPVSLDEFIIKITNDEELQTKHKVSIRSFEDSAFVHGDSGSVFNFYAEALAKHGTDADAAAIRPIMANLFMQYGTETSMDVNSEEFQKNLQAVKDGKFTGTLEPIVRPEEVQLSSQGKRNLLNLLRSKSDTIAKRIKALLVANGFKDVAELGITAWMGSPWKVRLAITGAQRREGGSWGPIRITSKATTQAEFEALQRTLEQRMANIIAEEIGPAAARAVVIDEFGMVGAPRNWSAYITPVEGGRSFPAEDVRVKTEDSDPVDDPFYHIETVYTSTKSKLYAQLDDLYDKAKKTKDPKKLAALTEAIVRTKKAIAKQRKLLRLPDFNSRTWSKGDKPLSAVTQEEWEKDEKVKIRPLSVRERARIRFDALRQAGLGAMDSDDFNAYVNDEEFRKRVDAKWEATSMEIEESLANKEKLRAADAAMSREVGSSQVAVGDGDSVTLTQAQKDAILENLKIADQVVLREFNPGDAKTTEELVAVARMGLIEAVMRLNNDERIVQLEEKLSKVKSDKQRKPIEEELTRLKEAKKNGTMYVTKGKLYTLARIAVLNHLTRGETLSMATSDPSKLGYSFRDDEARFASKMWQLVREYRSQYQKNPTEEFLVNKLRNYVEDNKRAFTRFDKGDLESRVRDFFNNVIAVSFDEDMRDEEGENTGGRVIGAIRDEYTGRGEGPQYYQLLRKEQRALIAQHMSKLNERERSVIEMLLGFKTIQTNRGPKVVETERGEVASLEVGEVAKELGLTLEQVTQARDSAIAKLRAEKGLEELRFTPAKAKPVERKETRLRVAKEVTQHLRKQFGEDLGVVVEEEEHTDILVGHPVRIQELLNPANFLKAKKDVSKLAATAANNLVIKPEDLAEAEFSFKDAAGDDITVGDLVVSRVGKGQYGVFRVTDVSRRPGGYNITMANYNTGTSRTYTEEQVGSEGTKAVYKLTPETADKYLGKASALKFKKVLASRQGPAPAEEKGRAGATRRPGVQILKGPGPVASAVVEGTAEGVPSYGELFTQAEADRLAAIRKKMVAQDLIKRRRWRGNIKPSTSVVGNLANVVDRDDQYLRASMDSGEWEMIRQLEKASGKTVVFYRNPDDRFYGMYDPVTPELIYINVARLAPGHHPIFTTALHEYVHSIVHSASLEEREALFKALGIQNEAGFRMVEKWARAHRPESWAILDAARDIVEKQRKNTGSVSDGTLGEYARAEERVIGEFISHVIQDRGLQSRFMEHIKSVDRSLFESLVRILQKAAASFKLFLTGEAITTSKTLQELRANVEHFEDLLNSLAEAEAERSATEKMPVGPPEVEDVFGGGPVGFAVTPEQAKAAEDIAAWTRTADADPMYWIRQSRAVRENQIVTDAEKAPGMITNNSAPTAVAIPGINDNKILAGMPGLVETLRKIAPTAFSEQAKQAAAGLRSELGHAERRRLQAAEILRGASLYVDQRMAESGQDWSLEVVRLIEAQKEDPKSIDKIKDPTARKIAWALRQLFDSRAEAIAAIDPNFIGSREELNPGYFPHIFKRSTQASAIAARRERASLEGDKGFTFERFYDTLQEGINEGLEPVTYNFVDLAMMRMADEDRFIAAHRFMKSAVAQGRARWVTLATTKQQAREREKDFATRAAEAKKRLGRDLNGAEKAALRREYSPASGVPDDWVPVDDPIARVPRDPTKKLYMPPDAANILNNFLQRSVLQDVPAYQLYRGMSNALNQLQLGWSFFHLMFTTIDAAANQLSVGLKYLVMGLARGSGKDLRRAAYNIITSPAAGLINLISGQQIREQYKVRGIEGGRVSEPGRDGLGRESRRALAAAGRFVGRGIGGVTAKVLGLDRAETGVELDSKAYDIIIDAIQRAGGTVEMDTFYRTGQREKFRRAIAQGRTGEAIARAPLGLTEIISSVILEGVVPSQKLGAFYQLARFELDRLGDSASPEQVDRALQNAWDSVDNRMGQLVYNNLFWNKTFKDILMATFRAVGWTFGSLREGMGAFMDIGRLAKKIVTPGEKVDIANDFTHKISYAIAMPVMVMTMGAILASGLGGGDLEDEEDKGALHDYLYPKTGQRDAFGRPERVQLASYMKDVKAWSDNPMQAFLHKLHPMIHMAANVASGHDYLGNRISEPQDGIIKRGWDNLVYIGGEFLPFSLRNMKRHIEQTGDTSLENYMKGFMMPFFGIVPAPASAYGTKAENLAKEFSGSKIEILKSKKALERQRASNRVRIKLSKGQTAFTPEELGPIGRGEVGRIRKDLKRAPILRAIRNLNPEEVMEVWDEMSTREKALSRRSVITKLMNGLKTTSDAAEKEWIREQVQRVREDTKGE